MLDYQSRRWMAAGLPIILIATVLIAGPGLKPQWRGYAFLVVLALLVLELAIIGILINGRAIGAFIDDRFRLSLSKLQAGAWTIVVLAAFATAVAFNAVAPGVDHATISATNIIIPGELLLAMGISATSLVATPGLLSLKAAEPAAPGLIDQAQERVGAPLDSRGKLLVKQTPADASWSDIVTGEELGNGGVADLGKIQQALITLVLLGCYTGYLFIHFGAATGLIDRLPALDKSFVWMLGVSHASYLAYKAAPHTASA